MTLDQILAFALFAFVISITPGPNNTMVLASGANFGLRPTIPHLLGIDLGFAVMIVAVGAGIGGLFTAFPALHMGLRTVGALYLLFLAWKIVRSGAPDTQGSHRKPLTFLQAASFQWVNPKGWIAATGAVATYTPSEGFFANLLTVTAVFALVMGPCITLWAGIGTALRRFLSDTVYLRVFNVAMAVLLVASLYPAFF
jgi:threonine/homoserine/homoserine lactone efflux protein